MKCSDTSWYFGGHFELRHLLNIGSSNKSVENRYISSQTPVNQIRLIYVYIGSIFEWFLFIIDIIIEHTSDIIIIVIINNGNWNIITGEYASYEMYRYVIS